ncbi:MAG: YwiC-like family protein, partial [Anaerolineaceae bacterium]|nr:YwiC-like family protein [Anaerolineaceae bacterium]
MDKSLSTIFRKHIALPTDHGSWVFLFSPLFIGLFAGESWTVASLCLIIGTLAAFLLRQPLSIVIKIHCGRRSRRDLPTAWFWVFVYGLISFLTIIGLILLGYTYILILAIPGILVFSWHLYLISKRAERRQAGVEIVASGVLALTAPAA